MVTFSQLPNFSYDTKHAISIIWLSIPNQGCSHFLKIIMEARMNILCIIKVENIVLLILSYKFLQLC